MVVNKEKIPYDEIDPEMIQIIKEINSLSFCATTSCCQGHPIKMFDKGDDFKYTADLYIMFEVYDELKFLKFLEAIQKGFYKAVNWWMTIIKEYRFDPVPSYNTPSAIWRINVSLASNSPIEIERTLKRTRQWFINSIKKFKGLSWIN